MNEVFHIVSDEWDAFCSGELTHFDQTADPFTACGLLLGSAVRIRVSVSDPTNGPTCGACVLVLLAESLDGECESS